MKIAIATDTNSGVRPEALTAPGLYLLPMPVLVDEQVYAEGLDIRNPQLYDAMKQHKRISTSQPAPGQVLDLWDRIFADGYDQLVYIPMSSGLSGSCVTAAQLAEDYDGRVQVVDNHRISVTQEESFFSAYRLAQQGLSAADIKAYLEERAYDASIYITVDSLEYLKKGGRITPAVAAFAAVLNLKPILQIQGDKLDTFAKARGMRLAETRMIEAVKADRAERFGGTPDDALIVAAAGSFEDPEQAERWRTLVQAEFPALDVPYAGLPCSIACHVGMNAVGIAVMKREAP